MRNIYRVPQNVLALVLTSRPFDTIARVRFSYLDKLLPLCNVKQGRKQIHQINIIKYDLTPIDINSLPANGILRHFEDLINALMTYANNLDPAEAPKNVGPHLRSKLFDT